MESFESSFAPQESHENRAHDFFLMRQTIQQALIMEKAPFRGDDSTPQEKEEFDRYVLDWIDKNHKLYQGVFEAYQKENPNLLEDWNNDSTKIVDEIKSRMSQDPISLSEAA